MWNIQICIAPGPEGHRTGGQSHMHHTQGLGFQIIKHLGISVVFTHLFSANTLKFSAYGDKTNAMSKSPLYNYFPDSTVSLAMP